MINNVVSLIVSELLQQELIEAGATHLCTDPKDLPQMLNNICREM